MLNRRPIITLRECALRVKMLNIKRPPRFPPSRPIYFVNSSHRDWISQVAIINAKPKLLKPTIPVISRAIKRHR